MIYEELLRMQPLWGGSDDIGMEPLSLSAMRRWRKQMWQQILFVRHREIARINHRAECPFGPQGDNICPRAAGYKDCLRPDPYAYIGLTQEGRTEFRDYRNRGCDKFRKLMEERTVRKRVF